jgi:formylglycine-generating enzyme required for sulfatase activity
MRRDDLLATTTRAEAGRVLAKLGDPRPEVLDVDAMQFCFAPAGKFIMSEGEEQKSVELPDYWIAKYPVTNAQPRQFVEAGGYKKPEYWKEGAFKGSSDREPRDRPEDYGEPFVFENHPVVGVSWHEALAFAWWLDSFFKKRSSELLAKARSEEDRALWDGIASNCLHVTLPTEAEWKKAARGTDGREYPCGKDPDPNCANCSKTGIHITSPAGCFPGGRSVNGAEEMSGNVFEWTRSLEDKYRILRGGSFIVESRYVRCAVRGQNFPDGGFSDVSFRVVVSPDASLQL